MLTPPAATGAILPQQLAVQNVEQVPQGPIEINVYPGPDCHGSLYEDDGNTLAYTRGESRRMQFTCEQHPESISVHLSPGEGTYKSWWNSATVKIYGVAVKPKHLWLNGLTMTNWDFDPAAGMVYLTVPTSQSGAIVRVEN